jgi:hypothetical protein
MLIYNFDYCKKSIILGTLLEMVVSWTPHYLCENGVILVSVYLRPNLRHYIIALKKMFTMSLSFGTLVKELNIVKIF